MRPIRSVLRELNGVRETGSGWQAQCPAHDDRSPSLSIGEGTDGRVLLNCHAGCSAEEILRGMGLDWSDVFPEDDDDESVSWSPFQDGREVASYTYEDEHGETAFEVVRFEPDKDHPTYPDKTFMQRVPGEGWGRKKYGVEPVLYRLPAALKAADKGQVVFVVEGEKDVHTLEEAGLTATCNPQGAGSWHEHFSKSLEGAHVVIVPDSDPQGKEHADEVAASVFPYAESVRIVDLPGATDGEDVTDWLTSGHTPDELKALASQTDPVQNPNNPNNPEIQQSHASKNGHVSENGVPEGAKLEWEDFPTEMLPPEAARYVQAASAAIGCDEAMIAIPTLSILAGAVGNSRRIQIKRSWSEPPTLWTMVVAPSGSFKTPARRSATRPVSSLEADLKDQFTDEYESFEAEKERYDNLSKREKQEEERPTPPQRQRVRVSDTTVESVLMVHEANPRGLTLIRDEMAGWFGSFDRYAKGESDMQSWCEIYNGDYVQVDRKTSEKPVLDVKNPSISVCGTIQPTVLRRRLSETHFESGFATRILMASPPSTEPTWSEADVTREINADYERLVRGLYAMEPEEEGKPQSIPFSKAAKKKHWIPYYNEGRKIQQAVDEGPLRSAMAKIEAVGARLALIFQVAENPNAREISVSSTARGLYLARWLRREAARVYQLYDFHEKSLSQDERHLEELPDSFGWQDVAETWGVSHSTAYRVLGRLKSKGFVQKTGHGTYEIEREGGRKWDFRDFALIDRSFREVEPPPLGNNETSGACELAGRGLGVGEEPEDESPSAPRPSDEVPF